MTTAFHLEDDFRQPELERSVLSWLASDDGIRNRFCSLLTEHHFPTYAEHFLLVRQGSPLLDPAVASAPIPEDPSVAIAGLDEDLKRRSIARLQQSTAAELYSGEPPAEILSRLAESVAQLRQREPAGVSAAALDGADLAGNVIEYARKRYLKREQTGKPVTGILTGLVTLDRMLNGLNPGLHVLAAGPGAGKTTLSLQLAVQAARDGHAVAYITYENSPANLMLKLLCAHAGLPTGEVERGYGDPARLEQAQQALAEPLSRMRFYAGSAQLDLARIDAGLLVFDYLQRAAHAVGYEQLRHNVSAMTGSLRDWAMGREAAVLAISSLNRSASDYGRGGAVQLENLKESGDLEYGADTVLLLYPPGESTATPPARDLELRLAKNRFGPLGSVRLIFRPDTGIFRERA